MNFLVLNGSKQKYARTRAFFDRKSILTSLIALEHFS